MKGYKIEAKAENNDPSRNQVLNHIESTFFKKYETQKPCYHAGDLEGNDARRLMGKFMIVFNEIHSYLRMNKPNSVSLEEIETENIEISKYDLNLVRIKWHEIHLNYTPKLYILYEHVPDSLLNLNGFYDMGEHAIGQLHQIRMRHHTRIRSLRSAHKQKQNQAKYE